MDWSDEEEAILTETHDRAESAAQKTGHEPTSRLCQRETALAVATRAVELKAANGLDMDQIRRDLNTLNSSLSSTDACTSARARIEEAITALGARVAALSVEMAKVVGGPTTTDCPSTEVCAVCETASGFPCNPRVRRHLRECGDPSRCALVTRYTCSPTCTHDDAATPGHAERVKERSEAFTKPDPSLSVTEAASYEQGAEAMRAAFWEAVDEVLTINGLAGPGRAPLWDAMKAAIEGATP